MEKLFLHFPFQNKTFSSEKMKNIIKFFLLASILFVSCKKDSEHDATGHVVVKGINKLIVSVVHHTYSISNVRVYLKNNATEFPGTDTTKYEWNMVSDDSGIAVFENLF